MSDIEDKIIKEFKRCGDFDTFRREIYHEFEKWDKDLRFKEQVIKTIEDSVANTKTGVNNRIGLENKIDEIFERRGTWDHLQREIKMRIKSDKEMFERINGRIHENIQKTGDKEGVEFSNRMDIKSLKSNGRNKNSKDLGILFEGNVVVAMLELSQLTGVQHPKVYSANGSVSDQNTRALTTVQIVRVDLGANSCLVRRIVGEEDQGSEGLYTVGFRDLIKLGMDLGNGTKTSPIERGSKVYFLNYEYQKIEKEQKQEQEPHVSTSIRQQDEYMYGTVVEVVKGDINKDEGGNGDTNIEVVVEVVANTGSGMSGGGVQQRKVSLNDMFSFGAISEQDRSKLYFDFLRDKGGKGNRDEMNENLTGDEMEMEMDESE